MLKKLLFFRPCLKQRYVILFTCANLFAQIANLFCYFSTKSAKQTSFKQKFKPNSVQISLIRLGRRHNCPAFRYSIVLCDTRNPFWFPLRSLNCLLWSVVRWLLSFSNKALASCCLVVCFIGFDLRPAKVRAGLGLDN